MLGATVKPMAFSEARISEADHWRLVTCGFVLGGAAMSEPVLPAMAASLVIHDHLPRFPLHHVPNGNASRHLRVLEFVDHGPIFNPDDTPDLLRLMRKGPMRKDRRKLKPITVDRPVRPT
jgi:hypothetical protein